jgi:UPF0176 protein
VKENIIISSFYHFQELPTYEELKEDLLKFCIENDMKGTILLAREGINSTISATRDNMNKFYNFITKEKNINISNFKESFSDFKPFQKMKVRLKKEIVAMGVHDLETSKYAGKYIKPKDWASFLDQEDVVLIDTRNRYEIKLGTFKNSINPDTKAFREFPDWFEKNKEQFKDKKVLMCCTGGVRCEKSTAYLVKNGYDAYHLEGGIIKYLEETKNVTNHWHGSCFVFDERVALNNDLDKSGDLICKKCSNPLSTDDIRDVSFLETELCVECVDHHG